MTALVMLTASLGLMLSPPRSALVPLSPRNYQVPLSMQLRNAAADMTDIVALGETLQIYVDTEDEEAGSLWAEATVNSIDSDSGEFMVKVTEWDSLAKDDPAYEAAYEEGPFTAGEEGEEWRRGVEPWDPGKDASGVDVGDSLQIFVDTEDEEAGSVWAAATVNSIDSDSGEFTVKVTEWDSLAKDDPAYEAAYEEGPFTAGEEGEEWRRPEAPARKAGNGAGVAIGDSLQIAVDTEDEEAGSVWAAATVYSIDLVSGEFMVKVTEWDSLAKDDPAYEAAYEEGPYTVGEEGEEWRRPASAAPAKAAAPRVIATTPSPEEAAAVVAVASAAAKLKRCGVDGDESEWPQLAAAVEALYVALYNVGQPIATDRRLVGDWQLIGCTSPEVSRRKGLTGLGAAVFTKLGALHYSFAADGGAVARETLEFFGKPVILNELRGTLSFSADGRSMQEEYTEADMGGQQSTSVFSGSFSTLTASVISTDGTLRIGRGPDGVLVFRKVPPGGLAAWLEDQLLPSDGGTYLGNPTWKGPMERA